jgi:hypothetical protein
MALFRKFFLKKTPDRLLEISDRVYGMYNSPLRGLNYAAAIFSAFGNHYCCIFPHTFICCSPQI